MAIPIVLRKLMVHSHYIHNIIDKGACQYPLKAVELQCLKCTRTGVSLTYLQSLYRIETIDVFKKEITPMSSAKMKFNDDFVGKPMNAAMLAANAHDDEALQKEL